MQHNGWDHALKVTADGKGLVGHAGALLLRKAADQGGLTGLLSGALRGKRSSGPRRAGRLSAVPWTWQEARGCWTGSPAPARKLARTPGS